MSEDIRTGLDTDSETARRLLAAAIRLFFEGEDEAAVTALASRADGLLREARMARGGVAAPKPEVPKSAGSLPQLVLAHGAFVEATGESVWPEGIVLWVYFNAVAGTGEAVQADFAEFVTAIEGMAPDKRRRFCRAWIDKLKDTMAPDGSRIQ